MNLSNEELSNKERMEIDEYLALIGNNPSVELVYLASDTKGINVITVCNFNSGRYFLKKEAIKCITSNISIFNIRNRNRNSRLIFSSDDIANYYLLSEQKDEDDIDDDNQFLEEERIPLGDAIILLDKTLDNSTCKKRIQSRYHR